MKNKFVLNKIFCCSGFQHRVADAGQRGIAVLVINSSEGIRFRLQSRGIAFADENKIRSTFGAPDLNINVSCETGLLYCPFCGQELQCLVNTSQKAFIELAKNHRKFYSEL